MLDAVVYYLPYVSVGTAAAAFSWSYGYAQGYKLARNNELRRVRERQRKKYDYKVERPTRRGNHNRIEPLVSQPRSPQRQRRSRRL